MTHSQVNQIVAEFDFSNRDHLDFLKTQLKAANPIFPQLEKVVGSKELRHKFDQTDFAIDSFADLEAFEILLRSGVVSEPKIETIFNGTDQQSDTYSRLKDIIGEFKFPEIQLRANQIDRSFDLPRGPFGNFGI